MTILFSVNAIIALTDNIIIPLHIKSIAMKNKVNKQHLIREEEKYDKNYCQP